MTDITFYNIQKAVTPEVGKQELWFLCSVRCPVVIYICIKFLERVLSYRMDTAKWRKSLFTIF